MSPREWTDTRKKSSKPDPKILDPGLPVEQIPSLPGAREVTAGAFRRLKVMTLDQTKKITVLPMVWNEEKESCAGFNLLS